MKWAILSSIWKLLFGNKASIAQINDVYIKHIDYLKAELEAQKKIIAEHKKLHPENGKELDEWLAREEKLNKMLIEARTENRDLKEKIIFLEAELKAYKKKHRSMYE
jgi:BMFP domain-containing protein YqiC